MQEIAEWNSEAICAFCQCIQEFLERYGVYAMVCQALIVWEIGNIPASMGL